MKAILVVLMLAIATPAHAGWFCNKEPQKRERVVEIRPAETKQDKPFLKILSVGASVVVAAVKIALVVVP